MKSKAADYVAKILKKSKSRSAAIKKAASRYKLNDSTLRKFMERRLSPKPVHGNRRLSDLEEATLVGVLGAFSSQGFAVGVPQVSDIFECTFTEKQTPSLGWAKAFLARNKRHLVAAHPQATSLARLNVSKRESVLQWIGKVEKEFTEHYYRPECIINIDETRLSYIGGRFQNLRVLKRNVQEKYDAVSSRSDTKAGIVSIVNAAGEVS